MKLQVLLPAFLFSAVVAYGAGFALNEAAARPNALQGTVVGSNGDASAVYYNPANLPQVGPGFHVLAGATLVTPKYDTRVAGVTYPQNQKLFCIPHFFLASPLSDDLYAGFGAYAEYGLGSRYKGAKNWALAADSYESFVESFTFSPTLAWQATDDLSLAAGFRLLYLTLQQDRYLPPYQSAFHMRADAWAPSYLLALSYQLLDSLRFGFVYRGETHFDVNGTARVESMGLASDGSGHVAMPSSMVAGLNWQATQWMNLGLAVTRTDWTCYDDLTIHFRHPALGTQRSEKGWDAVMRYSGGVEFTLSDAWALQFGYTHDCDPSEAAYADTMFPPGDRDQWGGGFTYKHGSWTLSMDYMMVVIHGTARTILGQNVDFRKIRTNTVGLSISKTF